LCETFRVRLASDQFSSCMSTLEHPQDSSARLL
jgi:hypothetical protein